MARNVLLCALVVFTAAAVRGQTCPCVTYEPQTQISPCPPQLASCGVTVNAVSSTVTTCMKVTAGAGAVPVDCCFCGQNGVGQGSTCSTSTTPCPPTPNCVPYGTPVPTSTTTCSCMRTVGNS